MYRAKCVGALMGVSIGFPVFALIGMQCGQPVLGCVVGIVAGAIIGYWAATGTVGRITVGVILGASIFADVGPAVDTPGLFAAPIGAVVGFVIGCAGWYWIVGFLGAVVGYVLGAMSDHFFCSHWPKTGPSPGQCCLFGMLLGGGLAVAVGYMVKAKVSEFFNPANTV